MLPGDLLESAAVVADDVRDLRRAIHADPELGLDNPRTQSRIVDALEAVPADLRIETGSACTSVVADLDGALDGPTVLLRADTDALPMTEDTDVPFASTVDGRAHACGHDAHTAMLVGAAQVLAAHRDELAGRVRFMFQPGEEGMGGARVMLDEGVLDGVDRAFALHITPNIPVGYVASRSGPIMASQDAFRVTVRGKGGHASTPHLCVDPLPATAEMITAVNSVITRELDAFDPGLISICHIEAGTTTNVIPETAFFEGTMRAVSERTRSTMQASLPRLFGRIAEAHRCEVEFDLVPGYPVTVNHGSEVERVTDVVRSTLGDRQYLELPTPVMGAEDFSYVLQGVPGAMALLGVCPDDVANSMEAAPCHSNRMRLNEEGMAIGVAVHAAMALASTP